MRRARTTSSTPDAAPPRDPARWAPRAKSDRPRYASLALNLNPRLSRRKRRLLRSRNLTRSLSPKRSPSHRLSLNNSSGKKRHEKRAELRRGIEDYYGLVGTRHHRLSNRYQFSLLI